MTAVNVSGQLVEKITLVGETRGSKVPEMVMGIADGQLGLEGFFLGKSDIPYIYFSYISIKIVDSQTVYLKGAKRVILTA